MLEVEIEEGFGPGFGPGYQHGGGAAGGPEDLAAFLIWLMKRKRKKSKRFKPERMKPIWQDQLLKPQQIIRLVATLQLLQKARLMSAYQKS